MQIVGVCLGLLGIGVVALDLGQTTSLLGFFMAVAAAASWASGNMFIKAMGQTAAVPMVTWGSLIAAIALLPLSLVLEGTAGWQAAWVSLTDAILYASSGPDWAAAAQAEAQKTQLAIAHVAG